jgi:phosphate transport system permease protein
MSETKKREEIVLTQSPQLRRRHAHSVIFRVICMIATWIGVVMLAVLIIDVALDSLKGLNKRVDDDPLMVMHLMDTRPGLNEQMKAEDPDLFQSIERRIEARSRSAERRGEQLTAADKRSIKYDVIAGVVTQEPDYFSENFDLKPAFKDRVIVLGKILHTVLWTHASSNPSQAGFKAALVGSLWLLALTALFSVPIGISAAIYLEEYATQNRLNRFIEVNIANLAGVPSVVYGILGLAVFVRGLNIEGWGLGRTVLAGSLTMSLLILPVIIIAAREAIKAVPDSIRQGAYGLGATKWQVVRHHVLPIALPGILTGIILAMSRAIGETAPLLMIGAMSYIAFVPKHPMEYFTVLPIQIYNWIAQPQKEFHLLAACGILLLLVVLLAMNSLAIYIRYRAQRNLKW